MSEKNTSTAAAPRKKFLIRTWGCQMNVYDSGRMADVLTPLGYEKTEDLAQADLVILNTCHIREKASEKLYSELGRLHAVQLDRESRGEKLLLAVAGCVAQAAADEIKTRAPYVSLIFGPQTYHQLPDMLAELSRKDQAVSNTEFPPEPKFGALPQQRDESGVSAFLTVQEGCDKFCTYCVVPYTRGAEYSRGIDEIVAEARALVRGGVKEITLLGQNVNGYRDPATGADLGALVRAVAKIDELLRVRYTTSHPLDMNDSLIAAHAEESKLMPFLHLPVQSGSDKILAAMNRKHTAAQYKDIVDKLRKAQPKLALSSDFIVGFPGETEADFQATLDLVRDVFYAQAFSFKFSRRPGTPAADMEWQLTEEIKEERLNRLQAVLRDQQTRFNQMCQGHEMSVLFESVSDVPGHVFGRSPFMQTVRVPGEGDLVGTERRVMIIKGSPNSLTGKIV